VDPTPRAPLSLRVWGWIFIASAVLSLASFSFGMLGAMAGGRGGLPTGLGVGFLLTLATGIGFVTGGRWSWFLGFLLAGVGLVAGVWYLGQVEGEGAAQARALLAVIWLGPNLLLLLCLFLPASLRWMRGDPVPASWATPMLPVPPGGTLPTTGPATAPGGPLALPAPPRSRSVPLAIVAAVAILAATAIWALSRTSGFPEEAAGLRLTRTMDVPAGPIFGPPVLSVTDPPEEPIEHRLAVYRAGSTTAEVRLFGIDLRSWPNETLLVSAGVRVDRPVRPVTAEADGVLVTCAAVRRGAACVWTDEGWTGWASSDRIGPVAMLAFAAEVAPAAT
jgi:hypothetical protein